jgi:hypothetical protein
MTKHIKRSFKPLTAAQIQAYRDLQDSQQIAWLTRNKPRAAELGLMIAELRNNNLAYRNIK